MISHGRTDPVFEIGAEDLPLLFEVVLIIIRKADRQAEGLIIRAHVGCERIRTLLDGLFHHVGIEI